MPTKTATVASAKAAVTLSNFPVYIDLSRVKGSAMTTEVDLTTPVVEEPTPPTQVDMGVFTGTETQIVNLRNKVKNNFKVEYLG
jgi:hypothetical protein